VQRLCDEFRPERVRQNWEGVCFLRKEWCARGGFELPTFWFVAGKDARRQTTPGDKSQRNQQITQMTFCSFWTVLYPVHGKLHGQFQRERLRLLGLFADAPRILTKPRCLMTVRMGVFFNRTLSRLSSNEVGTASSTRSARESATATCEAGAPRRVRLISLVPSKTPKFGGLNPPKHRHSQLAGSSELAMQPQPFVHSHSHSPAPHFAILHPRKRSLKIVRSVSFFNRPTFLLLPNSQH
jgi:hypothetical protein